MAGEMRGAWLLLLPLLAGCAVTGDAAYYARLETDLRAVGYLRTEPDPADATFSNADLVTDFERIALYSEFSREDGRFVERREASVLSKWQDPIRVGLVWGDSAKPAQRRQDRREVVEFSARLARLSGLDIQVLAADSLEEPNFVVIYANREERSDLARNIAASRTDPDPALLQTLSESPPREVCYVFTFFSPDQKGRFSFAVTVIKSETVGLMRLACVHEELAQALGLPNDDDRVRPSIFNDNEEFALLTRHDEYLLRMLYDARLKPGMTADEVRPLLPAIIAGLRPAKSN
jgi:Protein of unknown function (DUF2927)